MKPKIGLLAFLVIFLMVPASAFAALALGAADGVNAANTFGAGEYGVIGSFKVTDSAGGSAIKSFTLDASSATLGGNTLQSGDIDSVAVWWDKNRDGVLQRDFDTIVVSGGAVVGAANAAVELTPGANIALTSGEVRYFMVVILTKETPGGAGEGAVTDVKVTVKDSGDATSVVNAAGAWNNDTLDYTATHLQWTNTATTGYKALTGSVGGNVVNGAAAGAILKAVDDYGNTDTDFSEGVQFKAYNFSTLEDISSNLSALDGSSNDLKVGTSNYATVWASGVMAASTSGGAGVLKKLSHSIEGPVTLMAKTQTKRLEGSVTVMNAAAYTSNTTVNGARGIEIYDVDHDGHVDHATVFYNSPMSVTDGAAVRNAFHIEGNTYTIDTAWAARTNFDAGGTGIKNAGEFGVTIKLVEKAAYDTDSKPNVYYDGNAALRLQASATAMSAFSSFGAIEVDRARPILIKAETQDTNENGMLDGVKMTFSEAVRNVTAGADTTGRAFAIDPNNGVAFTGSVTVSGSEVTLGVGETTPNTGLKPSVWYNQNEVKPTLVTDFATSATNSPSYNAMYPVKANYSVRVTVSTRDAASMVVHSVKTLDTGGNGKIDMIEVVFSEDATVPGTTGTGFYSSVAAFSSGTTSNGIYTVTGVTQMTAGTYRFAVTEVTTTDVYDTEAVPRFSYSRANGNITDTAGNELLEYGPASAQHPSTIDGAAPVVVKIITGDAYTDTLRTGGTEFESTGANGRLDNVKLVFSEKVMTAEGAHLPGASTALNHVLTQFTLTHSVVGALTAWDMAAGLGKPTWTQYDNNGSIVGDSKTEVVVAFKEADHANLSASNYGDTGASVATTYVADTSNSTYNIKDFAATPNLMVTTMPASTDGAAPYLVDGLTRGWRTDGFANLTTVDSDSTVIDNTTDTGNGNGYIDAFQLKFTEAVNFPSAGPYDYSKFSAELEDEDAALSFKTATVTGNGTATIILKASPNYKGTPDTDETPILKYDGTYDILDGAGNKLAKFADGIATADGAKPVITEVNRGATTTQLVFTFSETVYGHYANGNVAPIDSVSLLSSQLFGYQNNGGSGSSSFTAAAVTIVAPNKLAAMVNAGVTASDIDVDKVFVIGPGLYDNAKVRSINVLDDDNAVEYSVNGAGLMVKIFDDVVAPWIIGAWTVDADGNGYVDHVKVRFSETVSGVTLKAGGAKNTMSGDLAATWKFTGYTGTVKVNLFEANNAGKEAAIAAGKPVFAGQAVSDDYLYFELEEDKVPAYATSGLGSTGWVPVITWGTGTDAVALTDIAGNVLDTASTITSPSSLKATNGVVVDDTGVVLMSAVYDSATRTIMLKFSEDVKDRAKTYKCNDFVVLDTYGWSYNATTNIHTAPASGSSIHTSVVGGLTWLTAGTANIAVLDGYTWAKNAAYGIQLWGNGGDSAGDFLDVKDIVATKYDADPEVDAAWQWSKNKFCPTPFADKDDHTNNLGLVLIENVPTVNLTAPSTVTVMEGQKLDIKWKSTYVDSIDIWVSRNLGASYSKLADARTVATAGKYSWTVAYGVNKIWISAANDSALGEASGTVTVLAADGGGGGTVTPPAAPANLVLADVPGDNGHWMFATFDVSPDHDTTVKSYQFYRERIVETAIDDSTTVTDSTWVYMAVVPKGLAAGGKFTCVVPTPINGAARWAVVASTGSVVSDVVVAAKETDVPVAMLVDAAEKAAGTDVQSGMSAIATGGAIDNIAPSAFVAFSADDNEAGGVLLSWTAPEDHGQVGTFGWGTAQFPVYGVTEYEVYRKESGAEAYELVGSAGPMAVSYVDPVEDGSTTWDYMVKGVDSAHEVQSQAALALAFSGGSDFTSDGSVGLGDLVLFGKQWGVKAGDANWVSAYDLNKDGEVGLGDLVLLGAAWTPVSKVAKTALPITNDIALSMDANFDAETSMYYVNINVSEADGFEGVGFTMSYDVEALELVEDGVTGLGTVSVTSQPEAGMVDVGSYYMDGEFDGTITVAFRSKGMNKNLDFELVNASVSIDNVLNAVDKLASVSVDAIPTVYALNQNFPNPFNPTTTIEYSIPQAGNVELVIFNMAGQKVRTLVNEHQAASYKKVVWDGRNSMGEQVGAGMYFYKLVSGNFSKIQKMTLIK